MLKNKKLHDLVFAMNPTSFELCSKATICLSDNMMEKEIRTFFSSSSISRSQVLKTSLSKDPIDSETTPIKSFNMENLTNQLLA